MMKSMKNLLPALLALLCTTALDVHAAASAAPAPTKPNVLFIAVDDLNDYISPLARHPGVKTPNFDRLAKRSVTFANAHCAAPACHPSRVAVMTGVHPSRSGIYVNLFGGHGPRWRDESPVLKDAVVISQHFRDHGYRAVGGGKLFHTLQWTPGDSQNDPAAWDEYRGDPLDPISKDWVRAKFESDAEMGLTPGRPLGAGKLFGAAPLAVPDEQTGDHMIVDWAAAQLRTPQSKPLFLAVGLFRPHIPWEVPQKWFDLHPLADVKLPVTQADDLADAHDHGRRSWHQWVVANQQWEKLMQGYLASMSYADHQLGRLLDALDASPLKNNTIIVLWSDHGFHIGEKENWEKFGLWTQTTRVPLFIHALGQSRDGQRTQQPATLTDLYPTLCELAGLPVPAQCDGVSLVPQLKDPATPRAKLSLTSYNFGREPAPSHAVSDPRYRFIRYGNGFEELYDLETDPHEFTNRASDPALAAVKARLAQGLPANTAPNRGVPADSKYNLRPVAAGKKKSSK
jgi:arylsulfatase A-like enzyme